MNNVKSPDNCDPNNDGVNLGEESEEWKVDVTVGDFTYIDDFRVSGPKRVQALQQSWQKLEDRLQDLGFENVETKKVGITLRKA